MLVLLHACASAHTSAMRQNARLSAFDGFRRWFAGCDGWISERVSIKGHDKAGAGDLALVANTAIQAEEVIAVVPHRCMLEEASMRKIVAETKLGKACLAAMPERAAEVFLMLEMRKHSPWRDYFGTFPTIEAFAATMPTMLPQEKLVMLTGSRFLAQVQGARQQMDDDFETFAKLATVRGLNPEVSRGEWFWACFVWKTRSWSLPFSKAQEKRATFFPVGDMLLHSKTPNIHLMQNFDKQVTVLVTSRKLSKGTVLSNKYGGTNTNRELFLHWGFVPPSVEYSGSVTTISLPFGPQCGMPFEIALAAAPSDFHQHPVMSFARQVFRAMHTTASPRKVQTERAKGHSQQCQAWLESNHVNIDTYTPRASDENEAGALSLLNAACVQAQAQFKTTLSQDTESLKTLEDRQERNLMLIRAQEKKVQKRCEEISRSEISRILGSSLDYKGAAVR